MGLPFHLPVATCSPGMTQLRGSTFTPASSEEPGMTTAFSSMTLLVPTLMRFTVQRPSW